MTDNPNATAPNGGPRLPFTQDQAREMADALVTHGGATREQADTALRADGYEPARPDTRTNEQREFDAMFPRSNSPAEFKINYAGRTPPTVDSPAIHEFHAEATSWLHQMDFPATSGASFVELTLDSAQKQGRMTPPELTAWKQQQRAQFERAVGGPEKVEVKMQQAKAALAKAPGKFANTLLHVGAMNDAQVLLTLAHQGERLIIRGNR